MDITDGEEIVKARFFIMPKDEHTTVQHVGCRLVLTEKMIHAGFKKGMVFNLYDGTVEVALEGKKKEIEAFHAQVKKHLTEWLFEKTDDKEKLKKLIGNPGVRVAELEYNSHLRVLDIGLYSHSLEMNQLENGVDVYYDLKKEMKRSAEAHYELREAIRDLREELAKGRS